MPQGIVDVLEVVEVQEQDRDTTASPPGLYEDVLQTIREQGPVGQLGQGVVQSLVS